MTYSSEVLADSPLVYWRCNDPSGTSATDSSGNTRTGTYGTGITLGTTGLLTGDSDKAITTPNTSAGRISIANAAWMHPGNFLTAEAVIKPSSLGGTHTILSMYGPGSFTNGRFTLRIDSNKLSLYIMVGSGFTSCTGTTTLSTGTIYHVAGTYDGTAIVVYVNGVADGTTSPGVTPNSGTQDLSAGSASSAGGESFAGVIDEVAYYGTALSSTRIGVHAAAVTGGGGGGGGTRPPFHLPSPIRRQALIRSASF